MKRFLLCLLLIYFANLIADEIIEYNFEYPQMETKNGYSELGYKNCVNIAEEGNPSLPQYSASILLPPGKTALSIEILSVSYYSDIEVIRLIPAGNLHCESSVGGNQLWESEVYRTKGIYPEEKYSQPQTGFLCGHPIVSFLLCPVEYTPISGEAHFIENITLKIHTISDEKSLRATELLRHDHKIETRLTNLVDNPSANSYYTETSTGRPAECDILLITNTELEPAFAEYIDYKQHCGYYLTTLTVEDIYAIYEGACEQEQIRNAIINYYQNYGIDYVILGGDCCPDIPAEEIIPRCKFYIPLIGLCPPDYALPADMYYACLDGNWNDDGDNRWGEIGEEDLYSELSLGRISVDNFAEIANQTHKLMMYDLNPVIEDVETFLMVAELEIVGGEYLDELIYGSSNWDFTTAGFSDNINSVTLYESDYIWESDDVFNCLEPGINMFFFTGGGRSYGSFKTYIHNINEETICNNGIDAGYFAGYSNSPMGGDFSNRAGHTSGTVYLPEDCFYEKLTTLPTGACCFIAYSGLSWFSDTSTYAPVQFFQRQFVDAVFGDAITLIGEANNNSQEENAALINEFIHVRNCCYSINLLGDPTLDIRTAAPQTMEVILPSQISISAGEFLVYTGISDARIAVFQDDELSVIGLSDDNGDAILILDNEMTTPLPLQVYISAHNYLRWEGEIPVISEEPYVTYENHTITEIEGNSNGQPDFGETIALNLEMRNLGGLPAENLELEVSTSNPDIIFMDNTEAIEYLEGDSVVELTGAISFIISDDICDQQQLEFIISVQNENNEDWNSVFQVTVNAPSLSFSASNIDDSQAGDNDGILDPGETIEMLINISNCGHCLSPEAILELSSDNPNIEIYPESINMGQIEADDYSEPVFTIQADNFINTSEAIIFDLDCYCDNYSFSDTLRVWLSSHVEDFESGDFNTYNWEYGYEAGWVISEGAYEGRYCAKSDTPIYSSDMILTMEIDVMYDGFISFYKRICQERELYRLIFKIDGVWVGYWEEMEDWSYESFPIRYGHHVLEWDVNACNNTGNGSDFARIDQIIFPELGEPAAPELVTEPEVIALECAQGDSACIELILNNTGDGTILLDIHTEDTEAFNTQRCFMLMENTHFTPGQSTTWHFTVVNPDYYWIQGVNLQFPEGVFVTSATDFVINGYRKLDWDLNTGNGILANWEGTNEYGFGLLHDGEEAYASVNITISEELDEDIEIGYDAYEEGNGGNHHDYGTFNLVCSPPWITFSSYNGSIDGGESQLLLVTVNSSELEPGYHECLIIVKSDDLPENAVIPVSVNVTNSKDDQNEIPLITQLDNCFPNPFNPETTIAYQLAEESNVEIKIYNIKGQLVTTLISDYQKPGKYQLIWNGKNKYGNNSASGVYFYKLSAGTICQTRKMVLLK